MSEEVELYDLDEVSQQIYHLRKAGKTFSDIYPDYKHMLTYDEMVSLYRSYSRKLITAYGADDRTQSLFMELERLDAMQAAAWPMASAGDRQYIETVLKVMAHRAKLMGLDQLSGTDQQTVNNILVVGGDQRAFIEALEHGREMIAMAGTDIDDEDGSEAS